MSTAGTVAPARGTAVPVPPPHFREKGPPPGGTGLARPGRAMSDTNDLIDAALDAAVGLPSPPAFQVWCQAYRAGRTAEEEAVKRAFRSVFSGLADGRFDDFTRLLAGAEARLGTLGPAQIVGWT